MTYYSPSQGGFWRKTLAEVLSPWSAIQLYFYHALPQCVCFHMRKQNSQTPRSLQPTLPGGSSTPKWTWLFSFCRTEDILLGCSSGSLQAEQGCTLSYTLSKVLSVLEPFARDAKGSTGAYQGLLVSRMCCCQDDVKEVELWDHYWPGSSQNLSHWAYILYLWILFHSFSCH